MVGKATVAVSIGIPHGIVFDVWEREEKCELESRGTEREVKRSILRSALPLQRLSLSLSRVCEEFKGHAVHGTYNAIGCHPSVPLLLLLFQPLLLFGLPYTYRIPHTYR